MLWKALLLAKYGCIIERFLSFVEPRSNFKTFFKILAYQLKLPVYYLDTHRHVTSVKTQLVCELHTVNYTYFDILYSHNHCLRQIDQWRWTEVSHSWFILEPQSDFYKKY